MQIQLPVQTWQMYLWFGSTSLFSQHNYLQGKSTIAVIISEASCICDTVAHIITLKSSSVCGKSVNYISPVPMTADLCIQKDPKDENSFPLLKELLVTELLGDAQELVQRGSNILPCAFIFAKEPGACVYLHACLSEEVVNNNLPVSIARMHCTQINEHAKSDTRLKKCIKLVYF